MPQHSRALSLPRRPPAAPLLAVLLACVAACDKQPPTGPVVPPPRLQPDFRVAAPNLGEPLANLTVAELALFNAGKVEFETPETVADGLGPVFNEASCATCHNGPVRG